MPIDKPGVYTIPEEEYHADPCPAPSLSRGVIRDLLFQSPLHAWTNHPRLNPNFRPTAERKYDLGSGAHDALLGGMHRVQPLAFENYRTKGAREERAKALAAGKLPVLAEQYDTINDMVATAMEFWNSSPDLAGLDFRQGMTEQSAFWQEDETIWCRARWDWISRERELIVDYKTTLGSVRPEDWARSHVATDGLDIQAAWYTYANTKAFAKVTSDFVFFLQESTPPYACSLVGLDRAFMEMGADKCVRGLAIWQECMQRDEWAAYTPRVHWVQPQSYHMARWEELKSIEEVTS